MRRAEGLRRAGKYALASDDQWQQGRLTRLKLEFDVDACALGATRSVCEDEFVERLQCPKRRHRRSVSQLVDAGVDVSGRGSKADCVAIVGLREISAPAFRCVDDL